MAATGLRLHTIVAWCVLCGCSSGEGASIELADCVPGVWVITRDCVTCSGAYVTPECGAEDCAEADVLVLRDDGTALDFDARWSPTAGSLSVVLGCAAIGESMWWIDSDGTLVQDFGRTTFESDVACTYATLDRSEMAPFSRAGTDLEDALTAAISSERCTAPLSSD